MIHEVIDFTNEFLKKRNVGPFDRILEVGSRQVNNADGRNLRDVLKAEKEYIGIDLSAGDGVDIVMDGHDIKKKFKANSFDLTVTTETLEHDNQFWVTIENMRWATKPGGWMLVTVPGGRCPFHEWPGDYWRFMEDGVKSFFNGWEKICIKGWPAPNMDILNAVMGYGRKPIKK